MPGAELGRRQVLARTKAAYDTLGNNFKVLTYFDRVSSLAEPILHILLWEFPKIGDPDIVSYIVGILFARTPE